MKKILTLALALVMLLSLCACGSTAKYDAAPAEAPAAAYEMMGDYAMPVPAPSMEMAEEESAYGGFAAESGSAVANGTDSSSAAAEVLPEKIIYSANASLETTEFDETLQKLNAMIESFGGFIESSSVSGANYYNQSHGYSVNRSANYTIRIPGDKFSTLMSELSTLGSIPYSNTYTDNVTSQYYDVFARLKAYQTQEERLIEMMSVAETVEDVIRIEDRLTEIRYQIDSFQSRLNNWDRKVSYSTVYLDITEVAEYTPTDPIRITYGQRLVRAMKNGLSSVGDFFADFLLWFLEALPSLILLGLIVLAVIGIIRRNRSEERRARRAAKKAAKKAKKAASKGASFAQTGTPSVQAWPLDSLAEDKKDSDKL